MHYVQMCTTFRPDISNIEPDNCKNYILHIQNVKFNMDLFLTVFHPLLYYAVCFA